VGFLAQGDKYFDRRISMSASMRYLINLCEAQTRRCNECDKCECDKKLEEGDCPLCDLEESDPPGSDQTMASRQTAKPDRSQSDDKLF
jgi:hypothetical protein